MVKRKIITIDEEKCNGCGNCVTGCQEGALQIVDGVAKLVNEKFCDGFGDCIGECPTGALKIEEKETSQFDLEATKEHVKNVRGKKGVKEMLAAQKKHENNNQSVHEGGCPGSRMLMMEQKNEQQQSQTTSDIPSQLKQWPVQIHLLSPQAPYLENSDLLVTADCVPVAYGNFQKLLKDKTVALGCPKLDDGGQYVNKLAQIFQHNNINSVTVVRMEVPCCGGLVQIVNQALKQAESSLDVEVINISIAGDIL